MVQPAIVLSREASNKVLQYPTVKVDLDARDIVEDNENDLLMNEDDTNDL